MAITEELKMNNVTVAEIVLAFPQAIDVLKEYNLDYCCGGKRPFIDACEKEGIDPAVVWEELVTTMLHHGEDKRMQFDTWDVPLLIDFIIQHHHSYVRDSIPKIQEVLDKVCSVHGEDSPRLLTIREDFNDLADELLQHLIKEEEALFPAIKKMLGQKSITIEPSVVESCLGAPINVMEHEHERAGDLMKSIRLQSDSYTPPPYACPTFRMAYTMLRQFDDDLMQHIHIENNILFVHAKVV